MGEPKECGVRCPEHDDPCSVTSTPRNMRGLARFFGGRDYTLREHKEQGGLHLCFGAGKPHTWWSGNAKPGSEAS